MERVEVVAESAAVSGGIAKSAPVAIGGTVSGLDFFGISVPDLVLVLTCIYLAVTIAHTAWKWCVEWRMSQKKGCEVRVIADDE